KNGKGGSNMLVMILVILVFLLLISFGYNRINNATSKEVTYTEFLQMIEEGKVDSVEIGTSVIKFELKDENADEDEGTTYNPYAQLYKVTYYTGKVDDENLLPLLQENEIEVKGTVPNTRSQMLTSILSFLIPLILIWAVFAIFMRRMGGGAGGMMGITKNNAKVYVEKTTGVTFRDVAGQDEAKESLQELVDFLHNPKKYTDIGAKLPKGALLVGPPGTGKTLLAKAVAGEANVPFFSLAGSDFVEMFVGLGASRVRDLFKEAYKQAPCIIFIDEIDAIGKSRDSHYGGGNDERDQTLNALLAEMDGFDTSKGLLILAATNRPEVLDKALLRPGRFDRRVIVDKPDLKGRLETLKVHSRNVALDETVDLEAIALATAGCVGSDLANMINEAAINAVKHGRRAVNQSDLFESFEVVIAGKEKKDRIMGPKEKRLVAYHEVGHALVAALQKNTEPVQKITIVPRTMGSLGYTLQTPEEEKYLNTKDELEARIVIYMGGRAAEEITCDSITTGAANDIEMATRIARAMVTQYGMSERFGLMGLESIESRYLDGRPVQNCGPATAAQIDEVVMEILKTSYDKAKQLLRDNREVLEDITNYLYDHETITGKEFMDIFRRWIPEGTTADVVDSDAQDVDTLETGVDDQMTQGDVREPDPEDHQAGVAPAEAFEEDDLE
ncbi:MAG: ATP-dependent zinc metalloprotease FtsH, partial [Lachnospiraceae bacterium]